MSHQVRPQYGIETIHALLTMARELLQIDEPGAVLRLTGRAIAELVCADKALLLVEGDAPLCVTFDRDGRSRAAHTRHPWYRTAHARMAGRLTAPPGTLIVAVPQEQPMAVLVAGWPAAAAPEIGPLHTFALETILELTAATLGRILVRSSLEQLVTTQYTQISSAAQEHADELARRDLAAHELLTLSLTDVLTGLNNRRGFFARADPLFRLAQRQHLASTVLYADVDGLKPVNDTLGHATGDQMIRDSASVLRASLRDTDVLARLGGDEFAAYTLDEARPHILLSRLQTNLDAFNLLRQRPYPLSFSVGLIACDPAGSGTLIDSVQQADRAMYEHKRRHLH